MLTSLLALHFHLLSAPFPGAQNPRGMPPASRVAARNPELLILTMVPPRKRNPVEQIFTFNDKSCVEQTLKNKPHSVRAATKFVTGRHLFCSIIP